MTKKFLALLLAVVMVCAMGVIPVSAASSVARFNTTEYATLQEAVDAAEALNTKDIVIDLLADATIDITAWNNLEIGADNTTSITINGNNHTLTFNQLNSDWNNVATNNDAKLILNDMTIANSGHNDGPWNRYDINFGCDVELNNVISNRAIAFKADATLNNVTINETKDVYAIWVQAKGQNIEIDGLTVTSTAGRGVKIDEQYIDDPVSVSLNIENATFDTAKKAAIVVKSAAGAEITAKDVDVSKVTADSTNLVWVDEDSTADFGTVSVNGTFAQLEGAKYYATFEGYEKPIPFAENATELPYIPAVPEKSGYIGAWESIVMKNEDFTVKAVYTLKTYTATFTANGVTIDTVGFSHGDTALTRIPAVPAKEGYYGYWAAYELNGDITVNAIYVKIVDRSRVSFVADGKLVGIILYRANQDELTVLPNVPAKEGYVGTWAEYTLTGKNMIVRAVYTPIAE